MAAAPNLLLRSLRIVDAEALPAVVPNAASAFRVETWFDPEGLPYADTYVAKGRAWIRRPGVATFSFRRDENFVTAIPCPGVSAARVEDTYIRFVLPLTVQASGNEVLHASAVAVRDGLIAFCGDSGSGKSTIGYALTKRGYRAWADDAVVFEACEDRVLAHPLPFRRRLRSDAIAYFGGAAVALNKAFSERAGVQMRKRSRPLRALFLVDRRWRPRRGREVEMRQVPSDEAFTALLPYCQPFTLQDAPRRRTMIRQYLRLSALVPVFELRFRRGVERLPLILDSIERAMRSIAADARFRGTVRVVTSALAGRSTGAWPE